MKLSQLMAEIRRAEGSYKDMLELKQRLDEQGISLENLYQELEMSSSYVDSHRDSSMATDHIQPHSHSFFELILCRNCDNVQYLLGSGRYLLQKGDVMIIPPGVSHCPLFPEEMKKPYERIVVWVNAELLQQFYSRWPDAEGAGEHWRSPCLLRSAGTVWEKPIADTFLRGCGESEKREAGWEAALYGNTTMLITLLNRVLLSDRQQPKSERSELLDELLRYVENNKGGKVSISAAARELLVSESSISHLCRKKLGVSFYRYVTQQRLVTAKQLMLEGYPLTRAGEAAGFCDYSSFYRAFRQEYGFSPKEYRELQKMSIK